MSRKIIVNDSGVNTYLIEKTLKRIYFSYDGSTNETTQGINIWEIFPYPSTSITTHRTTGDFTISNNGGIEIAYNGTDPAWFKLDACCNVYKGTGGNTSRNIELVWHLNSSPAGPVRGSHMNNQDSNIVTGTGEVYLSNGDVLHPMIRNIENSDKINLKNCAINIFEAPATVFS